LRRDSRSYFSDALSAAAAVAEVGADPEDRDECQAENVFWVPAEARWSHLLESAKWSNRPIVQEISA
jgi:type I restriction enzyme M protein